MKRMNTSSRVLKTPRTFLLIRSSPLLLIQANINAEALVRDGDPSIAQKDLLISPEAILGKELAGGGASEQEHVMIFQGQGLLKIIKPQGLVSFSPHLSRIFAASSPHTVHL